MTSYDIYLPRRLKEFELVIYNNPSQFDIFVNENPIDSNVIISCDINHNLVIKTDKNNYDIFVRELAHSQGGIGYYRTLLELDNNTLSTLDNLTLLSLEYMAMQ